MQFSHFCLAVAFGCFFWHFIFGDPTSIRGANGWVPLIGFFAAIGALT